MNDSEPAASPLQNLYGQKLGRKGAETRARLMKATANLLEKRSIMEVTVADIASTAGTSASAFYVYFDDVTEVVLAVARTIEQITPDIKVVLGEAWTLENSMDKALLLVKAYVAFWQEHHAILRIRNLAADEGDKRFEEVRHEAVDQIHGLLQARIAEANNGLDPSSGASAVLVLIERVAVVVRLPIRRKHSSRNQLMQSAAFLVSNALSPKPAR